MVPSAAATSRLFFTSPHLLSCPISPFLPLSVMDNSQELHAVGGNGMKKTALTTETEVPSEAERDEQALARLGKKPILKVCSAHSSGPFWRLRV